MMRKSPKTKEQLQKQREMEAKARSNGELDLYLKMKRTSPEQYRQFYESLNSEERAALDQRERELRQAHP